MEARRVEPVGRQVNAYRIVIWHVVQRVRPCVMGTGFVRFGDGRPLVLWAAKNVKTPRALDKR